MQPFKKISSFAIPLNRANVDTDAIIPKQFLKSIKRTGFGVHLFDEWRYLDVGYPGQDCSIRPLNKDFVLNQEKFKNAEILLARDNFGCGSSREHAPWALAQYGIKVIIAPSFADIFYNNCFKNGILPIVLLPRQVEELFVISEMEVPRDILVCLEYQNVTYYHRKEEFEEGCKAQTSAVTIVYNIDAFRKECLLKGLDDIGLTLGHADKIKEFEAQHLASKPWLNLV